MAKLSIQQAIEQAKANPNSEFATQLRKSIESGQLDQAAQTQGVDLSVYGRPKAQPQGNALTDIGSDIKMAGQEIKDNLQKRAENVQESRQAFESGEQSVLRTVGQTFGQAAGSLADTIGTALKTAIKTPLSQEQETNLKAKIGKFAQKVSESQGAQDINEGIIKPLKEWKESLSPAQQRDIDALGGIGALATEFIGVGAGKRVAQEGIDVASDVVRQAKNTITDTFKRTDEEVLQASKDTTKQLKDSGIVFQTAREVGKSFNPKQFADRKFAKTFKLAPSDVTDAENKIGGSISSWAVANDLIKPNADETMEAINQFKLKNYNAVRDAVGAVDETFDYNAVPELENIVDRLVITTSQGQSAKYKAFNQQLKDVAEKFNRGEGTLSDVQFVKSAFDDIESIFKRSGSGGSDFKQGFKFSDLGESRNQVQTFIEDIVSQKLKGVDIRELNRNVSVSKTLVDDIINRSGKFDTQSAISLGDYFTFGLGQQVAPGLGVATFVGKKIVESSPVRLALAKAFADKNAIKATDLEAIQKTIADEIDAQFEMMNFNLPK